MTDRARRRARDVALVVVGAVVVCVAITFLGGDGGAAGDEVVEHAAKNFLLGLAGVGALVLWWARHDSRSH
jgi:hypothetical protein